MVKAVEVGAEHPDDAPAGEGPLLVARDVSVRYRRRQVLRRVGLELRPGEVVGVSGENGSGKTTLLRVLAGTLRPDAGRVLRRSSLGFAPQPPLLYEHLTVREHFRYVAAARDLGHRTLEDRSEALRETFRFEAWADARAGSLSEGTRQKLNLALALLADPEVLLLDEPYSGFEWETYLRFWEHALALRDRGRSVVVVSHLFQDRARLDRLLRLEDGRLGELRA